MLRNIKQFSWAELFSNESGKTSATAFCGVVICMCGTLCFVLGCIDKMYVSKTVDIITQSIVFVGIGATLMGVRKVYDSKKKSTTEEKKEED